MKVVYSILMKGYADTSGEMYVLADITNEHKAVLQDIVKAIIDSNQVKVLKEMMVDRLAAGSFSIRQVLEKDNYIIGYNTEGEPIHVNDIKEEVCFSDMKCIMMVGGNNILLSAIKK